MTKIAYLVAIAIALAFLIAAFPSSVGQFLAQREIDKENAEFEARLEADVREGHFVKQVTEDGRIEYRNAHLPDNATTDATP